MANGNAFSAVSELEVEERLFMALVTGSFEQSEGLLDSLDEVDVRITRQKTLLHVGVSLGKVDWVEELLARGADPNLKDGSHKTAVSSAEELLRRFPEDRDRRKVMKLVSMVNRRDQAMRRRLETSSGRSSVSSTPPVFRSEHMSALAALKSSMVSLKEEIMLLKGEMKSSLEVLREKVCGRDALLRCLEAAVTSSAEQLTSLSVRLQEETTLGATGTNLETPLPMSNMADERRECVDGMMSLTMVIYGGEEGVCFVRRLYERLYDEDDVTACLLKFLHRESRLVVKVDCGSDRIERMKEKIVNLDGREESGYRWRSVTEVSTNTVYLGAKVFLGRPNEEISGWFANSLAQMSLHLSFNNVGEPYEVGDGVYEREWWRVFSDVERRRNWISYQWVRSALDMKTQRAKYCLLAASVPTIIAEYGSTKGTRMLLEKVPHLFHYYKEHVVATLLAKARE